MSSSPDVDRESTAQRGEPSQGNPLSGEADSSETLSNALQHPHASPGEALHDVFSGPPEEKPDPGASPKELLCYGVGACSNDMMSGVINGLVNPILNITLGISPGLIGITLSIRGFFDAFTDPVMGYISDNATSRWGRRRPFILVGGILMSIIFLALWTLPRGWSDMSLIWYFGIGLIVFAAAHSIFSVAYYALGIELSSHYHGRTRVVVYRDFCSKMIALLLPWFFPFCLLPIFRDAIEGVFWLALIIAVAGVATSILVAAATRERPGLQRHQRESFFKAFVGTVRSIHFVKITMIYVTMLFLFGVFQVFGFYIVIYYVFNGDLSRGATFFAILGTFGCALAIFSMPLVMWLSRRYEKHNALRIALILMIIGSMLNLVCCNSTYPALLFIPPLFYSLGITSTFTILGSLMADVVDVDELKSGRRREGMFGAAASYFMKVAGASASAISGFVLVGTGFDVKLGGHQNPHTYIAMILLYSMGPTLLLLICLALLHRYPLTESYIRSIAPILEERRKQRLAASNSEQVT